MGSTIAAGSSYSTHREPMIPFYIFYSMFGFQRTGDWIYAMADQLARGFLVGATAGRTTLTGEGLQHADGHSPLIAATNPAVVHYDAAWAFELSHITQHGLQRMYGSTDEHPHGENVIFYLTVYNEPVVQPAEPDNLDVEGLLKGIYRYRGQQNPDADEAPRAQVLVSGVAMPWALDAQRMLAEEWSVAADVWSVTSWNELTRDAVATDEWNFLNPGEQPRTPYVTQKLQDVPGPVVAVSDFMRAVPDQIAQWVPGDWSSLGTDGFGFADTRPAARRFFHVDAQSIVVGVLKALAERGEVKPETVKEAFDKYRIDDPTAVRGVKQTGGDA
jgi:pyruvate dehydrogenase E1 component